MLPIKFIDQNEEATEEYVNRPEETYNSQAIPFEALLPLINESLRSQREARGEALDALDAYLSRQEAILRGRLSQARSDVARQSLEAELEKVENARCQIAFQMESEQLDHLD